MLPLFITLDLGTGGCKCGVIDLEGNLVASASVPYPLFSPSPGLAEQNSNQYWSATVTALKRCISKIKNPHAIKSITICGQDQTLVLIDKTGKPIRNAIIWMDSRAKKQTQKIEQLLEIFIPPSFNIPKLLWVKENEPTIFYRTYKALSCKGLIYFKLTGKLVIDFHYEDVLYDEKTRRWDIDKLTILGIPVEIMPELVRSGEIVGLIDTELATRLGLSNDVVVIAGGPYDTDVGKVGLGLVDIGDAGIIGGTSASYSIIIDKKIKDNKSRVLGKPNAIQPDLWELEAIMSTAGGAFDWFVKSFYLSPTDINQKYTLAIEEAQNPKIRTDELYFLPHLSGERSPYWSNVPKGAFVGISLKNIRAHFGKAVLEGVAFMFRLYTEIFSSIGVKKPEVIKFGGGMVKNKLWLKIIADVLDAKIQVPRVINSEFLGGTIIAARSLKYFKTIKKAAEHVIKIDFQFEPDSSTVSFYNLKYPLFKLLYPSLEPFFKRLESLNL